MWKALASSKSRMMQGGGEMGPDLIGAALFSGPALRAPPAPEVVNGPVAPADRIGPPQRLREVSLRLPHRVRQGHSPRQTGSDRGSERAAGAVRGRRFYPRGPVLAEGFAVVQHV